MEVLRRQAARLFVRSIQRCGLIFGIGLCLFPASFGQETGKVLIPLVHSVAISVTSHINETCGNTITGSTFREDATALLVRAGFIVSNVHNAVVSIDTDCVAIPHSNRSSVMTVNQCLSLSETAPDRSNGKSAVPSTIWRECKASRCIGLNCQELAQSGLHDLLLQLWSGFQENDAQKDSVALTTTDPLVIRRGLERAPASSVQSIAYMSESKRAAVRKVFYSLYLMNCLTLLVYWQFRRSHF